MKRKDALLELILSGIAGVALLALAVACFLHILHGDDRIHAHICQRVGLHVVSPMWNVCLAGVICGALSLYGSFSLWRRLKKKRASAKP